MEKGKVVCPRCNRMKKIYKSGSGYSLVNTGGVLVTCPMCNGEGIIDSLEEILSKTTKKKGGTDGKGNTTCSN